MGRPRDLRELAERVRQKPSSLGRMIAEFADTFYLAEDDAGRQACLDPVPDAVGDPLADAWIGATGEHLASRWRLAVPAWVHRDIHFRLRTASYHPPSPAVAGILFVESPPAFRTRRLFVNLEPLVRARFPAARRAVMSLPPPPRAAADAGTGDGRPPA